MCARPLTRRHVLQGLAASSVIAEIPVGCAAVASPHLPNLVLVYLSGGLDGLACLVPTNDASYSSIRGPLVGSTWGASVIDGSFTLHPALDSLQPFYSAGELAPVVATGQPGAGRAHAVAKRALWGASEPDGVTGWLRGAGLATATDDVGRFEPGVRDATSDLVAHLALSCPQIDLRAVVTNETCAPSLLSLVSVQSAYGSSQFLTTATAAGQALADPFGPRVAYLELAGFDTHVAQGGEDGRLAQTLKTLADGLVALASASGQAWRRTAVMVITEFGRSVRFNAKGGTDHGTASITFLLGGAVAGGRVLGRWPGLAPYQLYRGIDLVPTTDLRSIIKATLSDHMGMSGASLDVVYPQGAGITPMPGLFRA